MKIYNPGNAFCICQNLGCTGTFLVDPWIAKKAYADGWIPPVYTKDLQKLVKKIGQVDFVLITHIHEDHLDKDFLKQYANTGTKIVFPRVFGWKYMERLAQKIGIANQLHILDFNEKLNISNLEIQAVPPINTDSVNDTDKIGDHALSIDAGFIITDKPGIKVAFMADNNPYNLKEVQKSFAGMGKINLFCISHSGFASDYPFHYGYSREDCLLKYTKLEKNRQKKQLDNIQLVIKPDAILAYSSSFLPNAWVDKNWWECAKSSKYFNTESAASEFENYSSIKTFGLSIDSFLDLEELKKYSIYQDVYFNDIRSCIYDSLANPKLALKYTISNADSNQQGDFNYSEIIDDSKKNFHAKADNYKLSPLHEIKILVDDGNEIVLRRASNLEGHSLSISLSQDNLLKIMSGKLHWDSAMLSFTLNYKREPDIFCKDTYDSLLNFHSTVRS